MGFLKLSIIITFFLSASFLLSQQKRIAATVEHCHDGDTCTVKIGGAFWANVRLVGIDAPEVKSRYNRSNQPLGQAAQKFLTQLIGGKQVEIAQVDIDPYNRPIVEIYLAGKLVNLMLLERGYAEVYRGKIKRLSPPAYYEAERTARKHRRGIWGLKNYRSPTTVRD